MKHIIIADDDPSLRDAFELIFDGATYRITILSEGESIVNHKYDDADAFILDKQLSGMDGIEICRLLKKHPATKHKPVLLISASPDIHRLAKEAGADDYVEKPFRPKDLLQKLEQVLSRR